MKKLLLFSLAIVMYGQSYVLPNRVQCNSANGPQILELTQTSTGQTVITCVVLGSGITLNTATNPPTLNVTSVNPGGTSPIFRGPETPTGAINASNTTFTLQFNPIPNSTMIFRNGILQAVGLDYNMSTASTNMIIFSAASTPQTGDLLIVYYRSSS